jgi:hypothetical protein
MTKPKHLAYTRRRPGYDLPTRAPCNAGCGTFVEIHDCPRHSTIYLGRHRHAVYYGDTRNEGGNQWIDAE